MKCKDCACADVCYYKAFNDVRAVKRRDDVEKVCKSFVNRDAVEVVRCKDCKYCGTENLHCDHPMGTTFPFPRKIDDFCSYGERKENE